ncbi:hypothetical protein EMGBS15_07810 [Filimonas sp.]|nr:hypothetical protein EMGBS15_07810 [Filimonas sp.]
MITKPLPTEYNPYFETYINLVPTGADVLECMEDNMMDTEELILSLPKKKHEYRYAEGKWTIKEILQHLIDTERIFCYRALCFARGEQTSLPGYDENDYAANSFANNRDIDTLLDEFDQVRSATLSLFKSFDKSVYDKTGTSNNHPLSVRAIAHILAGHELHHMKVIQERYL